MADKSAGEASVKIVPDAKNFIRDLENDLKRRKAEFAVNVTADTTRAAADIDRLRVEQERRAVNLKVKVDKSSTNTALNDLKSAFGDLGSAASGVLGSLKLPLILTGIGELPAATTAIVNVAGALQQLSGAGAALPGILGGVVSTVGTVKLALDGVGDAFDALDKASDGSAKNVEAANKALAKLAPSAADFVRQVHELAPAFDDLKKNVQGKFFDDLGTSVKNLANADLPVLNKGLGNIATSLNGSLKQIGISLSSGSTQGLLDRIFGNTAEAQTRLTKAIDPLIKGLGTITAAGTDVLPRLADDIGSVAERFSAFITEADQNGTLSKFINDGITGFENLGNTVINIGKVLNDITGAAGGDGGLLKFLDEGSAKLHEFLSSTEGQNKLKEFFAEGRDEIQNHIIPLLRQVPGFISGVVHAGQEIGDVVVPILKDVAEFLGKHPDALKDALELLVAFKTVTAVGELASSLGTISSLLGGGGIGGAAGGKGGLAGRLGGLLGPGLALGGALGSFATDSTDPNDHTAAGISALSTIGGGALTGFQAAGPWGAAVGALIGGAAALTDAFLDQAERLNKIKPIKDDPGVKPDPVIRPGAAVQPPPGPTSDALPGGSPLLSVIAPGIDAGAAKLAPVVAQIDQANKDLGTLSSLITTLPTGQVELKQDTPEAIKQLTDLGVKVTQIPGGKVEVDARSLADALAKANNLKNALLSIGNSVAGIPSIPIPSAAPLKIGTGHASGGVLPGYSPGVDNMLVPLAGGEGIIRPEAVRKYGPGVINMLNSGFATGGTVPDFNFLKIATGGGGGGKAPGPAEGSSDGPGSFLSALFGGGGLGGLFGGGGTGSGGTKKDPGDFLGELGAKTLLSFGTTLYKGVLGFFGLENSALSPDNPYFQDATKLSSGIFGQGEISSPGAKPATSKQVREATDKVTDKRDALAVAQARVAGLKPNASPSARLSATNALSRAQRESDEAVADLAGLQPSQGYAKGGIVGYHRGGYALGTLNQGVVPPPPPRPNFKVPDVIPLQPRPAPKRPSVPVPIPVPLPHGPSADQSAPAPPQQPFIGAPAPTAGSSGSVESHTLPAISKGITSGFATAGNLAATAISLGSAAATGGAGGGSGGGAGQFVQGLFQQAGKIANDVVDVGSAFLVGNITPGTQDSQYGSTLVAPQNVPQTAQSNGRQYLYTFNGIDSRNVVDEMRLKDAQDNQALLAQVRG